MRVRRFHLVTLSLLLALPACGTDGVNSGGVGGLGKAGAGGSAGQGGSGGVGGTSSTGADSGSGGTKGGGGTPGAGGETGGGTAAGGKDASTTGGSTGAGGAGPIGGTTGSGGQSGQAGARATGGASATGGQTSSGGGSTTGGSGTGGRTGAGGMTAAGGTTGSGGATTGGTGPCDIYASANTPCVAAHSTVRALYGAYDGAAYQLRRASDKTTKDVPLLGPGGFIDISVQDAFCKSTTCTISIIYDQSPNKNDLVKSGVAHWLPNGGIEADAAKGQVTVGAHTVHGIYVTSGSNVAYRNNATKGVPKGNTAEAMYMVVDGKRYSDQCCFDYGNAETSGNDDGNGTMEAVYFGNDITWGGKGEGNGPWVAADLENGVFKCDKGGWQSQSLSVPNAKALVANYVTVMLKGPAANTFAIKGGSALSGTLTTMWNGARPSAANYYPKRLQGAIILGTGGDGSNTGTGTFFEGAMTSGTPPDSVDDAIQANIVAAGYGR